MFPVVVTVTLEPMRRRAHAGGTIALILLAAGLTGCSAGTSVAPQPASASGTVAVREGTAPPVPSSRAADNGTGVAGPSASPPLSGAAASALGSLEVKGRAPKTGYSRARNSVKLGLMLTATAATPAATSSPGTCRT